MTNQIEPLSTAIQLYSCKVVLPGKEALENRNYYGVVFLQHLKSWNMYGIFLVL